MKRLLVLLVLIVMCSKIQAQPWMPLSTHPVKLQDIIEAYRKNNDKDRDEEKEKKERKDRDKDKKHAAKKAAKETEIDEDGDYQFDRWVSYWKNHLDPNGYMVSQGENERIWEDYLKTVNNERKVARTTASDTAYWAFQGPARSPGHYNGLGRINNIAFHPTDSNTFIIGSAGGGAWRTTDGGITYASIYGNLPTLGVSHIDYNPLNANTIFMCTGDADGGDNYSAGVYKSTNGGASWAATGLSWVPTDYNTASWLVFNPRDTSVLMLATNSGIFRSTDAGATWTNIYSGNFRQVMYNPADTTVMYATGYLASSFTSSQIFRSADGGLTWHQITGFSDAGRIAIATVAANPAIVKAVVADNVNYSLEGIYNSSDSGQTFIPAYIPADCSGNILSGDLPPTTSSCSGGQGWYDLCITIDPEDTNFVLVGGVNTYYSTNGGYSWTIANQWYSGLPAIATVHADKHFLSYNPIQHGALYEGDDGGIYESLAPATELWTDLTNGLGITQFYRIAVDGGATFVLGGAQDNGSKSVSGIGDDPMEFTGGDGMECHFDPTDPTDVFYTASQYGDLNITTDGGHDFVNISSAIPGTPTGDWTTPYLVDPEMPNLLLAGYDKIYVTDDYGSSWTAFSPSFGPNINRLVMSAHNTNYVYAVVDNNTIHYTADFGTTWSEIVFPHSEAISDIAVDPKNEKHIWVTLSGYSTNKTAEYNLATTTWTLHNAGLPNTPVNCIVIDSGNETKYIGTSNAVFYMDTTMTSWALYNTNLPNVQINDLGINYNTNELWAGTFGRGMWKTQKIADSVDTSLAVSIIPYAADVITVAPNPSRGHFVIHTTDKNFTGKAVQVTMLGSDGKSVWENSAAFNNSGNLTINASGLSKGTYICEVQSGAMIARVRVIIL